MNGYTETFSLRGDASVTSLSGSIRLEEGRGRLVIYDPVTQKERVVHDIAGSHYKDEQGRDATLVDIQGLTSIEPATGRYRTRAGTANDGRTGFWNTKPGIDLRDEGI